MSRIRTLLLSMGLVVATLMIHSTMFAQGPGDQGNGGQGKGRGRQGGGGGGPGGGGPFGKGGGFGGGFGGRNSSFGLLDRATVQEELKITEDQKKQLKTAQERLRKKGEDNFKAARENSGTQRLDPETMQELFASMTRDTNTLLSKILNKGQRTRLSQIALQQEGPMAVTKADMQEKLNLAPEQVEQINMINQDYRQSQMELFRQNGGGRGGRGGRGGNGNNGNGNDDGGNGGGGAQSGGGGNNGGGGGGPGGGGRNRFQNADGSFNKEAFDAERNSPEAKAKREEMQKAGDSLREDTIAALGKVLTRNQKNTFNKMLGEPFDIEKGNAAKKDETKKADAQSKTGKSATAKGDTPAGTGKTTKKKASTTRRTAQS
ncbi:hypothetical protein ACYOEI_11305 [Singulisphaera rosea]